MASPASSQNQPSSKFEAETIEAVSQARGIYARIIEQKCPESKAVTSVAKAFGVHRKLAWQLVKTAYAPDPFVAAQHMPSAKGVEVWLQASAQRGVDAGLLEALRAAQSRFQDLVSKHAASKTEFDMLIESTRSGSNLAIEERWRQQAFEGNAFTWGARCKVLLGICILMPSDDREHHFHAAQVRGLMRFRQTRPNVRWVVSQSVAVDDDVQHEQAMQRAAIDPASAAEHNGVPVLPGFCSHPMPPLERSVTHDGMVQDEFLSSDVGLLGERTLVTGEILRNIAPVHATPQDKVAHFGSAVRTPAEMLHFDVFVRQGLFGEVDRELRVFSDIASPIAFRDADALRVSDEIQRLGRGLAMTHAPDLPGYQDLAADVFDRLGADPDAYELFRVRMAYPPVPTTVMVRHDLLAMPD